ncbi:ECF transporter S component [Clostridium sp. MSJ-11]|uniref:ECF transporter S component n=1 Tax=Clostridium mobile TaxID=2841512 RepID=A0ABS6EIQ6_9CLOT|nr:ECF transporter S component [Clostridium mobile]MBU5484895.1 ECF transporter S component [Clostridium mobile]
MNSIKKITYTALLTALAVVIPIAFGFLSIQLGPFSATLASHVPLFIAILLGPGPAAMVGIGSGLGFLITKGSYIAARAFMHTFVGIVGGLLIQRGISYRSMVMITAPIHGILEALIVIPFGITLEKILITVGLGSTLHHIVDGVIAFVVVQALYRALNISLLKKA